MKTFLPLMCLIAFPFQVIRVEFLNEASFRTGATEGMFYKSSDFASRVSLRALAATK